MVDTTLDAKPYLFADRVFPVMRIVLLAIVTLTQAALGGPQLFAHQDVYRPAWAADTAFAVLASVSVVCAAWVLRGKPLPLFVVVLGTVVVLFASAVATGAVPSERYFSELHWSFGLVGWHLFLLLADRVVMLVAALGVWVFTGVVQFAAAGLPDRATLGAAAIVLVSVTGFQFAAVAVVWVLHRRAAQTAEVAAEQDRLTIRQALAEQRGLDHRQKFAGQLGATLPLLAGLADGTLDPRAPTTVQRVTLAATQLRRLFAENDDVPDPLVHELSACVDVAERRGLAVSLAISGETVPVPTAVRRDLTGPVITALSAARSRARVSLLRTDEEVRVAVVADTEVTVADTEVTVADAEAADSADAGTTDLITSDSCEVNVAWYVHGKQTRMETRWRPRPTWPY